MKKTLFIAVFIAHCLAADAQKLELGVNGGLTPFVYATDVAKNFNGSIEKQPGYYGSFRASLIIFKWQIGLAADKFQVGVKSITTTYSVETKFNSLAPYVFANKLIRLPKSFAYVGINGGLNFGNAVNEGTGVGYVGKASEDYSGFNGGVQAGYTIKVLKGLGANIEAGARYMHMQYKSTPSVTVKHIIFPVSLGIHYIF